MELYHGSKIAVAQPVYGHGRSDNDYGRGFYCTRDWNLAAEWAAATEIGGFVNRYDLPAADLSILDLCSDDYHILHWLALLISHRQVRLSSPSEKSALKFITENYLLDTSSYDVICGYRADDSYFSFVRSFLSNTITVEQLSLAMDLGELGIQYMIKSPRAFDALTFLDSEPIDGSKYYSLRSTRDIDARKSFYKLLEEGDPDGHTIRDLMKGGMSDEKLRIL